MRFHIGLFEHPDETPQASLSRLMKESMLGTSRTLQDHLGTLGFVVLAYIMFLGLDQVPIWLRLALYTGVISWSTHRFHPAFGEIVAVSETLAEYTRSHMNDTLSEHDVDDLKHAVIF